MSRAPSSTLPPAVGRRGEPTSPWPPRRGESCCCWRRSWRGRSPFARAGGLRGATPAHSAGFVDSAPLVRIAGRSRLVAAASTALTLVIALVPAYAVTRSGLPGRRPIAAMGLRPLVSPPYLAAVALALLAGRNGIVSRALGGSWSLEGATGIVAAQVVTFVPAAYARLANVPATIEAPLEEAAEGLGCQDSKWC